MLEEEGQGRRVWWSEVCWIAVEGMRERMHLGRKDRQKESSERLVTRKSGQGKLATLWKMYQRHDGRKPLILMKSLGGLLIGQTP